MLAGMDDEPHALDCCEERREIELTVSGTSARRTL